MSTMILHLLSIKAEAQKEDRNGNHQKAEWLYEQYLDENESYKRSQKRIDKIVAGV